MNLLAISEYKTELPHPTNVNITACSNTTSSYQY